jgi:hypothetical protein
LTIWKRPYLLAASSAAIVLGQALAPGTGVHAGASSSGTTFGTLVFAGTTSLAGSEGTAVDGTTNEVIPNFVGHQPKNPNLNHVAADGVPNVVGNAVSSGQLAGFAGFNAINHLQQRRAGTGIYKNTQFTLEPPDQGLCVGGSFVLEAVNDALRVYDTSGSLLSAATALNQFYKLKPAFTRSTPPVFGDFVSDPKCYFDPADQRWFVTALQIGLNPETGDFQPPTHLEIAVSQTSDPTGMWNLFSIDTTDDGRNGTPTHVNCPCFGDQPLIGADANGFYISTNEYGLVNFPFNGAQVYAMSKSNLESGSSGAVVHINAGIDLLSSGGLAFTVQPATAPSAGGNETANGGTEYFVSDLDFTVGPALGIRANRLAVWALTNTSSLSSAAPSVSLTNVVIDSELYLQPPNAEQKSGELFLGELLHNPLSLLAGNDDRLNQVVFADGKLWTAVNTAITAQNGPTRVGTGYFIVAPSDPNGTLSASIVKQGYVAVNQENLLFPSIGVTSDGKGVITFSLVGPDFFPSTAYAAIDATHGVGDIHIAGAGQGPEDGFTGYDQFGGDVSRWGDYTAAVAVGDTVWFATEYIAHPATDLTSRTLLANWATFVAHVTP